MQRSDLFNYSDAYIVAKEIINVRGNNANNRMNKKLTFKNNAPFKSCISKINNTFFNNAENLDIFIPIYNLLEYSDNYSQMSGSLWNYYRDEVNDSANENNDANTYRINNSKRVASKSFKYKTKIIRSTLDNDNKLNTEVVLPLKYLSNFSRSLDLPSINGDIEIDLPWSEYYVISEISRTLAVPANSPVPAAAETQTTSLMFQINNAKHCVPVVTLSITDNIKFQKI